MWGGLAGDAFLRRAVALAGSVRCAHSEDLSSALAPLRGERLGDESAPDEAPIRRFTGGGFFPPDPRREPPALAGWRVAR